MQADGRRFFKYVNDCFECLAAAVGIVTSRTRKALKVQSACRLQHPNLLRVFGACKGSDGKETLVVYQLSACATLFELLRNPSVDIPLAFAVALAKDVACGLDYLHTQTPAIIGKNLRSHHIFVGDDFRCMLGVSFNSQSEQGRSQLFKAPELMRGQPVTVASDVYSFGMLLYEILHRQDAFQGEDPQQVMHAIRDSSAEELKRPDLTTTMPPELEEVFTRCWSDDPTQRPTLSWVIDVLTRYADKSITQTLWLENQNANKLLRQILPEHAVRALQAGRRPSERSFPLVTIYFSDIKGFTSMSSNREPREVMDMLDDLYTRFDRLCNFHGLMKIETIGDSYMLVGGLREEQPDHTARVARFALDANEEAKLVQMAGRPNENVSIRSGFHAGPVTAGVVGTEVPRYCLFGDCTNVASRMESTGEPNRIQMSAYAASLLREQDPRLVFRIRRRAGDVPVKGKAPMQTYWLYTDADLATRPVKRRASEFSHRSDDDAFGDRV